jgi:hypothetical protein
MELVVTTQEIMKSMEKTSMKMIWYVFGVIQKNYTSREYLKI